MMHRLGRLARESITALGVLAVLVAAAPDPRALRAGLGDAERWAQQDGVDLVVAQLVGAVAWLAALWLAVGIALVAGARLPGSVGHISAVLARGALPAGVRRTAAMALGVSLAASTVPALGGAPALARQPTAASGTDRAPVDWPLAATGSSIAVERAATGQRSTVDMASVDWPIRGVPIHQADGVDWPLVTGAASPGSSVTRPGGPTGGIRPSIVDWPAAERASRSTVAASTRSHRVLVVVRPGDTLWSIASRRLGPGAPAPAIVAEWRRWHAANRDLIGPDPRRLRTGVSLRVPGST